MGEDEWKINKSKGIRKVSPPVRLQGDGRREGGPGAFPHGRRGQRAARSGRGGCAPSAWSPPPFAESGSSALESRREQGVCGEMSLSLFLSRPALRVLCAWISPPGPWCLHRPPRLPAGSLHGLLSCILRPIFAGPGPGARAASSCAHSPPTIRWLRSHQTP